MGRKIIAVAGIMFLAIPAFAAVQNVKVSGDITTYGVWQDEFDLNDSGDPYANDAFLATITRLRIDADLTDNVSATIRLLNERVWDTETAASTDIDLDLSYLTLKEVFYSPLTLIIGRQNLRYGNALIVGDPDTNAAVAAASDFNAPGGVEAAPAYLSARKAFDAIRAIFDYEPWTIDIIAAKIDESDDSDDTNRDHTLYGINIAYEFAEYEGEVEGYYFFKDNANAATFDETNVIGIRGSFVPVDGLTLAGELAYQFGDYSSSRDLKAWALDVSGKYTFAADYEPTIWLGYSFRSGEEAADSGDYEAWDPMYEDQTRGLIADYLFGGANNGVSSNAHIINLGGSIKPLEDLSLAIDWFHYILDEELVATGTGTLTGNVTSYTITTDDDLGDEIDISLLYDYSEDVQFGLTLGWFLPGDTFNGANDDDAVAILGHTKVSF